MYNIGDKVRIKKSGAVEMQIFQVIHGILSKMM